MKPLLEKIRAQVEAGRAAFARLTQREQFIVLGGAAFAILFILLCIGLFVSSAIDNAERRVKTKTDQLAQVLALQGEYKARELQRAARMRELRSSSTRLVSVVEDTARQAGVEIGQLTPEDKEPNADGVVESEVRLRATNLSADRLEKFLSDLERQPGVVIMRRLKIVKPYRKDTADLELTVTTYRMKS